MANGFGSLHVGASGIMTSQNGLNVIANNLANVDTKGYVRQQAIYEDRSYLPNNVNAAIAKQQAGLGVNVGDVIHARDMFLDKAYRAESGRQAFYEASYIATDEVFTLLDEDNGSVGTPFSDALHDLYQAFAEFSTSPAEPVNQNMIVQKSDLFLERAREVYDGMVEYSTVINTKISDQIDRINYLGRQIYNLNQEIQKIEAGKIETAMDARDARDMYLDELGKLANISYSEMYDGVVKVKLEGKDFVIESRPYEIGKIEDKVTHFITPYWKQLTSNMNEPDLVFDITNADPTRNSDIGELKALLLARGTHYADMRDMVINPNKMNDFISQERYERGVGKEPGIGTSVMMNEQAELDLMMHNLVVELNEILSPTTEFENTTLMKDLFGSDDSQWPAQGEEVELSIGGDETIKITRSTRIFDEATSCYGIDGKLPPAELFTRVGCERFRHVVVYKEDPTTGDPISRDVWLYNEEDPADETTCYTLDAISLNKDIYENPALIAHRHQNDDIAYDLGARIYEVWERQDQMINPSDTTPCGFATFYTKMVGELATVANVFKSTSESLSHTKNSIESNRQMVIGVSTDEELQNMIKFQNAYNASSRYMTVVSQMIESLLGMMS